MTFGGHVATVDVLFSTKIDSEDKIKKSIFFEDLKSKIEFCTNIVKIDVICMKSASKRRVYQRKRSNLALNCCYGPGKTLTISLGSGNLVVTPFQTDFE